MRAKPMLPVLALVLGLISLPAWAETAGGPETTATGGPKTIRVPDVMLSATPTDADPARAQTLAEEILSAATEAAGAGQIANPSDAPEAQASDSPTATDPAIPAQSAAVPASPEVVLAVATSGLNRAAAIVEDLNRETIEVRVSISQQMMEVWYKGEMIHEWPVSTARKGKVTPKGSFKPQWLSKNHKSSLYNNAPMPYSIFYSGNYAIHGTDQESKLGRPASAGCVRLSRANAKILFAMVQEEGKSRMKVEILD